MADKKFEPTPEQEEAINHDHDKPAIVAAAAGSGKTTLLVERVVRLLSDERLEITADSLAIMTFTKNATKSMREKLTNKLTEKLEELADSDNENDRKIHDYLKKQIFLLRQASISTIDAFCLRMIRENAEAFDLPLNVTLADGAKKATMQSQAMSATLEELYSDFSDDERDALFFSFSFEDDYKLEESLRDVAEKLECFPDPEKWMNDTLDSYKDMAAVEANYLDLLDDFLELNVNKAKVFAAKYSGEKIYDGLCDEVAAKRAETTGKNAALDNMENNVLPDMEKYIAYDEKRAAALVGDYNTYKSKKSIKSLCELMAHLEKNSENPPQLYPQSGKNYTNKKLFNNYSKVLSKAVKDLLSLKPDFNLEQSELGSMQNALRTYFKLLKIYRRNYELEKRAAGCIDFSDCERELYNKLAENGGDNDFRQQLAKRFRCVIVDEFQDCNNIQAEIFKLLGEERLFYVGDVKQSIYSFRGADPYIMAELCDNKNSGFEKLPLNTNFRSRQAVIDTVNMAFSGLMTKQFGGVDYDDKNKLNMGLDYPPTTDKLYDTEIALVVPSNQEEDEDDKKMTQARYVAQRIQELVNNEEFLVCDSKDKDNKWKKRRARYSDFIVLLRSNTNVGCYRKALAELDIPSAAKSGSGFFDADEVKLVRNYLKIIDNPLLNEEFLKVLMSPIYRLTAEEAALIRMGLLGIEEIGEFLMPEGTEGTDNAEGKENVKETDNAVAQKNVAQNNIAQKDEEEKIRKITITYKKRSLFSCVKDCLTDSARLGDKRIKVKRKISKKLERFAEDFKAFRYYMTSSSLVDLVRKVYEDTDLISIVAAFEDSAQRVGNIRQLQRMAAEFESRGGGGLGDFLRFLERAADNDSKGVEEAARPEGGENSVRIMTFHASKGLEAPVCIMAELQNRMIDDDYSGNLLLNFEHYMAMAHTNIKRRKKSKLIAYQALSKFIRDRRLGDELRLLYVAMTRAQEKLIMVSELAKTKYNDFGKFINGDNYFKIDELHNMIYEEGVPFNCVFKWLLQYAPTIGEKAKEFSFEEFACRVMAINPNVKPEEEKKEEATEAVTDEDDDSIFEEPGDDEPLDEDREQQILEEKIAALSELINGKYAHPEDTVQQAKYTTTELAHKKDAKPISLTKPSFASKEVVSGVEKGNAYHHCMQHFPLDAVNTEMSGGELLAAVTAALDELEKSRKITPDERKIVEPKRIAAFFENELGKRMLRAYAEKIENVKREQSFYAEVNGDEVRQDYKGKISIQGQIDMYFIEDGEIIVVDYKSDTIENLAKEQSSYEFQVEIYTKVLGKLTGMNVKEMYLYAFLANKEHKIGK